MNISTFHGYLLNVLILAPEIQNLSGNGWRKKTVENWRNTRFSPFSTFFGACCDWWNVVLISDDEISSKIRLRLWWLVALCHSHSYQVIDMKLSRNLVTYPIFSFCGEREISAQRRPHPLRRSAEPSFFSVSDWNPAIFLPKVVRRCKVSYAKNGDAARRHFYANNEENYCSFESKILRSCRCRMPLMDVCSLHPFWNM